jgi:hypothetical protein
LLLAVAGCGMTMEDVELAGTPAGDEKDCRELGFEPGSEAMAQCMNTAAMNRQAELNRL